MTARLALGDTHRTTMVSEVFDTLLRRHRDRAAVGFTLMAAQAFFYNAIFFTYALVLTDFYGIAADQVGLVHPAVRARQFPGPVAARPVIRFGGPQGHDLRDLWLVGPAAGPHRLAVRRGPAHRHDADGDVERGLLLRLGGGQRRLPNGGRVLPLEIRALTIALFYAFGTLLGGVGGPWLFGVLIETGSRWSLFTGYILGSVLMLIAAGVMLRFGIAAERRSLEEVSRPLSHRD